MIEPGDNDWNLLEEMVNRLGVSVVTDALERMSDDTDSDSKEVEVVIADRKSSGTLSDTIPFTTFEQLKDDVESLVTNCAFYKVTVELLPNWKTTPEEDAELKKITGE